MNKKEKVISCFELINNDLDNTFTIERLKLLGISQLNKVNDDYLQTTVIVDPEEPDVAVFEFDFTGKDLKDNYELLKAEMIRSYINDLYFMVARGSIRLYFILKGEENDNPAFHDNNFDEALQIHNRSLSKADKEFLDFFHDVRNCMIHYDGEYNIKNKLNFEFCGLKFITTTENIGKQIIWNQKALLGLYNSLKNIYNFENFNKSYDFKEKLK